MKRSIWWILVGLLGLAVTASSVEGAGKKTWNNPANEQKYKQALRQQQKAYQNEAKAWKNHDRELKRTEDDVRRVRNEAMKGAAKGSLAGPGGAAAGAAWGGAKGAAKSVYYRAKDKKKR
jgi:hypothetical protein